MSKAKDSPLRNKMLELHRADVDVKFIGKDGAQVFKVVLGKQTMEEHIRILGEVWKAINASAASVSTEKLTRQTALSFVEGMKKLNH